VVSVVERAATAEHFLRDVRIGAGVEPANRGTQRTSTRVGTCLRPSAPGHETSHGAKGITHSTRDKQEGPLGPPRTLGCLERCSQSSFQTQPLKTYTPSARASKLPSSDALPKQLEHEPFSATRNRKPLRPNELASWELRIGDCRVFYDVDASKREVLVKAVGRKTHNKLLIRGKEYRL
jgi:mRNA-degrading endonuclease RelE of RelBE toxin-antitoxin system